MSKRFPRAQVEVTYKFSASHCVPESKNTEARKQHDHDYWVTIGFHHERNGPFTWDREELHERFVPLISRMDGRDLNQLCGGSATDEVLATWMLDELPGWVDFVSVRRLTRSEASVSALTTVRRRDLQ